MTNPLVLRPTVALSSDTAPVLCLCDALQEKGYEGIASQVIHKADALKRYDIRQLPSKRRYLQCVLALEELFSVGIVQLPSGQPSAYYELTMLTKTFVELGLGAARYLRMIDQHKGKTVASLAPL